MKAITLYFTVPSSAEAERIGRILVERRLVACVNVFDSSVTSIYRWNDAIESSPEKAVFCKTTEDAFDAAAEAIREAHPYDTPCIVAWPLQQIDSRYATWIDAEVSIKESSP